MTSLVEISERVSTIEKTRGPRIESWNWEEGYYQGGDKEEIVREWERMMLRAIERQEEVWCKEVLLPNAGLPDLANKNARCPVKLELQINNSFSE